METIKWFPRPERSAGRDFVNEITDELNAWLNKMSVFGLKKFGRSCGTYFSPWKGDTHNIAIRVPGSTRGHVEIDDNGIIVDFAFYDTAESAYRKGFESCVDKYIGRKMEVRWDGNNVDDPDFEELVKEMGEEA